MQDDVSNQGDCGPTVFADVQSASLATFELPHAELSADLAKRGESPDAGHGQVPDHREDTSSPAISESDSLSSISTISDSYTSVGKDIEDNLGNRRGAPANRSVEHTCSGSGVDSTPLILLSIISIETIVLASRWCPG